MGRNPPFANDEVAMRQRVPLAYRNGDLPAFHDMLMRNAAMRKLFAR